MRMREEAKKMVKRIAKYAPFAWAGSLIYLWVTIIGVRSGNLKARVSTLDEVVLIILLISASVVLLHILTKIALLFKDAWGEEMDWKKTFMRISLLLFYAAGLSAITFTTFVGRTLQGVFLG